MKLLILLLVAVIGFANCKVFSPGEFTDRLRANGVPDWMYDTWNCIVNYESHYDTQAHNSNSGDHGIFQISELFWCSPPGGGCGMSCDSMKDDNIDNDIQCAMKVYDEHQHLTGNGFTAWVVYGLYCS